MTINIPCLSLGILNPPCQQTSVKTFNKLESEISLENINAGSKGSVDVLGDNQCQVQGVLVDLGTLWVLADPLQGHPAEIQRPHVIAQN